MTELSDYKRIVERPMIAKYEQRIDKLSAALNEANAERKRLKNVESIISLWFELWGGDKPLDPNAALSLIRAALASGEQSL